MNLYSILVFILFTPVLTFNVRHKRQLDISYGSPSYKHCECGRKNRVISKSKRIVGGYETLETEYPWMALLVAIVKMTPKLVCGASLINDRYVLSAAHCINSKYTLNQMKVILGQHNFCQPDIYTVMFSVEKFLLHPKFIYSNYSLPDIMLIKLNMRISFNAYIRPICLPQRVKSPIKIKFSGLVGEILGWGLSDNSNEFCILRQTSVVIYSKCRKKSPYVFCAGDPQGVRDSCIGDSGGPFQVMNRDGKFELFGITSSGFECGDPDVPAIYTDVTYLLSWIYEASQDAMFCWK